jgi:hypothetical protein
MKKTLLTVTALMALALPSFANSFTTFNGGWGESYLAPGVESYIYGYSDQSVHNGYNYMWFEGYNCCYGSNYSLNKFSNGYLQDYWYTSDTKGWSDGEIYGSLFKGTFNSKTDVFRALFSGYEWVDDHGTWGYYAVTGTFTEQLNFNPGANGYNGYLYNYGSLGKGSLQLNGGPGIPGMNTVPEPGSLTLLGTGLISLAGALRKKLRGA